MVRKSVELRGGHQFLDAFDPDVWSCLYNLMRGLKSKLVIVDKRVP